MGSDCFALSADEGHIYHWENERLRHFVDRTYEMSRIKWLLEVQTPPADTPLPVLVFCAVGEMGKTSMLDAIRAEICYPSCDQPEFVLGSPLSELHVTYREDE